MGRTGGWGGWGGVALVDQGGVCAAFGLGEGVPRVIVCAGPGQAGAHVCTQKTLQLENIGLAFRKSSLQRWGEEHHD